MLWRYYLAVGALSLSAWYLSCLDDWAGVAAWLVALILIGATLRMAFSSRSTRARPAARTAAGRPRPPSHARLAHRAAQPGPGVACSSKGPCTARSRSGAIVGLLFVDLDHFKLVNDRFGHPVGDDMLREAGRRMQEQVRAGDVVARLGGDEYLVLLEPVDANRRASRSPSGWWRRSSVPVAIGAHEVSIGASIGAAFSIDGGTDADRLLAQADAAVYRAKSADGRGSRCSTSRCGANWPIRRRSRVRSSKACAGRVRAALPADRRRADPADAGLRGPRTVEPPGVGMVPPDQFIPMAEASNLIFSSTGGCWKRHCGNSPTWIDSGVDRRSRHAPWRSTYRAATSAIRA